MKDLISDYYKQAIVIMIFFIILFTSLIEKFNFIPDFLNLAKLESSQDFFSLVIGAIASIFGILMAVIILSVEFFKEKTTKNKFTNPLDNTYLKRSIFFFISLITITFIAYIFIKKFDSPKFITTGYYIGILFIIYLFSLFAELKNIVGKSSQINEVLKLVDELKFRDFQDISRTRYNLNYDQNILRTLKKEVDSFVLDNKMTLYEDTYKNILKKAIIFMGKGHDRRRCEEIISALTWLWSGNCKTAIRADDSQFFDIVWTSINDIYLHAAENKIPLINLQEFESFIFFEVKSLYKKFNNTISLNTALDVIENSFRSNIERNCPDENNSWDLLNLYEDVDEINPLSVDTDLAWDHLVNILDYFGDIQSIAIELDDTELFEECNHRLYNILFDILHQFKNLGKYQRGYLIWHSLTGSYYRSSLALDKEIFPSTMYCFNIPKHLIQEIIKSNNFTEKDIRIIIKTLGDYLFQALKKNKLDVEKGIGTFHDFYLIGIHSVKKYNASAIDKKVVDYYFSFLENIKKFIELEGVEKYNDEYKAIESAMDHFILTGINQGLEEGIFPISEWKSIKTTFLATNTNVVQNIGWEIL